MSTQRPEPAVPPTGPAGLAEANKALEIVLEKARADEREACAKRETHLRDAVRYATLSAAAIMLETEGRRSCVNRDAIYAARGAQLIREMRDGDESAAPVIPARDSRIGASAFLAEVLAYVRSYAPVLEDGCTIYGPYQDASDLIADGIESRFAQRGGEARHDETAKGAPVDPAREPDAVPALGVVAIPVIPIDEEAQRLVDRLVAENAPQSVAKRPLQGRERARTNERDLVMFEAGVADAEARLSAEVAALRKVAEAAQKVVDAHTARNATASSRAKGGFVAASKMNALDAAIGHFVALLMTELHPLSASLSSRETKETP